MTLKGLCSLVVVVVVLLAVACMADSSSTRQREDRGESSKAAEHWLPLLFLMNGSSITHYATTWMIGAICLGVTLMLRNDLFQTNHT